MKRYFKVFCLRLSSLILSSSLIALLSLFFPENALAVRPMVAAGVGYTIANCQRVGLRCSGSVRI